MKKQIISESRLREIISEEALRMKKRLSLESEKKTLIKKLNEMYKEEEVEGDGLDEIFGLGGGAFKKAANDYKATHKEDLEKLQKAFKEYSDDYITISQMLTKTALGEARALAAKYEIDPADVMVVHKDIMTVIQPMDFTTFKNQQKKGGWSMGDLGGREQTTGA